VEPTKPKRRPCLKLEVDGSRIPNSQKRSPSLEDIKRLCSAIQDTWDEDTENSRRDPYYQRRVDITVVHGNMQSGIYYDDEDLTFCDS